MSAYARHNATVPSAGARVREGRIYNKFWNILDRKKTAPHFSGAAYIVVRGFTAQRNLIHCV